MLSKVDIPTAMAHFWVAPLPCELVEDVSERSLSRFGI
jgi:hypothetical protein